MKTYPKIIIDFLIKYLFIMNAASEGWRVCYIGGNRFEFHDCLSFLSSEEFVSKYSNSILFNI